MKNVPEGGLHLLYGAFHSHLAGVGMRVRHFRNGEEIEPIMVDDHYDFNFQNIKSLPENTTILRGDELLLECDMNTERRGVPTFGGQLYKTLWSHII